MLRAAAQHTRQLGQARGWSRSTTLCVLDGLVTVLTGQPGGERVLLSEVRSRPHRRVSRPRLIEVLADLGLLEDDSTPSIQSWIHCVTTDLTPGFAEPVRHWLTVLLEGDARARPRSASTLHVYFGCARPFLEHWATRYDHLREVTRADITAALKPLTGSQRFNATCALRSLFRFAKKRGLIFANPTAGLKTRPADFALLPMTDEQIRAVEQLATDPAWRVIVALAAENAARTGAIRSLKLTDVDLANRRITLAGRRQRLGDLGHRAIRRWLDHRRTTWPTTVNPHLLVGPKTVHSTAPISQRTVSLRTQPSGCTVDRIRRDRILHEALTAGPDPLHLTLVFGIAHNTAARYAAVAQLCAQFRKFWTLSAGRNVVNVFVTCGLTKSGLHVSSVLPQEPEPGDEPMFVYYEPVAGAMAVKRWDPGKGWLEAPHEKFAWMGILTCVTCGCDLRPNVPQRRSAFNIPDQDHPVMRLYCGECCNDGVDEMERLTALAGSPGRR
ncbi:site-specific integrase [Nocardia sp. GAS34]|uniref:site-specific integrase n=1 Tax=unclassified Nocardia TaxID=2637762 RepID=UPI003D203337